MKRQSGNAFFVTLLSVVLLGALTFVLSRQMGGVDAGSTAISAERASIYADKLMGQALVMQDALIKMSETGTTFSNVNFILPSDAAFNTGSNINKVYHPGGGGVNLPMDPPTDMLDPSYNFTDPTLRYWQVKTNANTEWTPTTDTDILYSFLGLSAEVCAALNEKITGSKAIPVGVGGFGFQSLFTNTGTPADLISGRCPSCVGYPMLCVQHPTYTYQRVFYTIAWPR